MSRLKIKYDQCTKLTINKLYQYAAIHKFFSFYIYIMKIMIGMNSNYLI